MISPVLLKVFYSIWTLGSARHGLLFFTEAILKERAINVFNNGNLKRDFTFIDDIITSLALLLTVDQQEKTKLNRVINIGNNKPENLLDFINILEKELGLMAKKDYLPMQQGDVYETYADISQLINITQYNPKVSLQEGLKKFVSWYKDYNKLNK